jgi:hypothetical protein
MRERINGEITSAVQKILFKAQADIGITNGDVSPEMTAKLDDTIEQLTEIIIDVLRAQM